MRNTLFRSTVLKVIVGIIFFGAELFAQAGGGNVGWGQVTSVPMSPISMAIMVALFLMIGSWMLFKTKKYGSSMIVIALLATGVFSYKAVAVSATVTIEDADGASGTKAMMYLQTLQNNSSQSIKITSITPDDAYCTAPTIPPSPEDTCIVGTVLQTGESCLFRLECPV